MYLDALEYASVHDDLKPFQILMHRRLDATVAEYLGALQQVSRNLWLLQTSRSIFPQLL